MNLQRFITVKGLCSTKGQLFLNGEYLCDTEEFSTASVLDVEARQHVFEPLEGIFKINVIFSESYNKVLPTICDDSDTTLAYIIDDNTEIVSGRVLTARNNNIRVGFNDSSMTMRCSMSVLKSLISKMKEACFKGEGIDIVCSDHVQMFNEVYETDLLLHGFPF